MKGISSIKQKKPVRLLFAGVTPGLVVVAGRKKQSSDNYINREQSNADFSASPQPGKKTMTRRRREAIQRCRRGYHLACRPWGALCRGVLARSPAAGFAR